MNTNFIRQFTHFSKSQRLGLLLLSLCIIATQLLYLGDVFVSQPESIPPEVHEWLSDCKEQDTLVQSNKTFSIYPFNPNFLTAYKAYRWGMTAVQFERLQAFRKQNRYVNSVREFQELTQVPDTVLQKMAPYFKFPDWVKYPKRATNRLINSPGKTPAPVDFLDLNSAQIADFEAVRGIGPVLAERIVNYRSRLGAFVSLEQLDEVYGLQPEVLVRLKQQFDVLKTPELQRIKINEATIKELGQFPYFRYPVSRNIVAYRSMNGDLTIEELTNVKGINLEKLKIIALYLEF